MASIGSPAPDVYGFL